MAILLIHQHLSSDALQILLELVASFLVLFKSDNCQLEDLAEVLIPVPLVHLPFLIGEEWSIAC